MPFSSPYSPTYPPTGNQWYDFFHLVLLVSILPFKYYYKYHIRCALCVRLLSHRKMILKFIHVVMYSILFYCWVVHHNMTISQFVYLFSIWQHLGCFHIWAVLNTAVIKSLMQGFCVNILSFLVGKYWWVDFLCTRLGIWLIL